MSKSARITIAVLLIAAGSAFVLLAPPSLQIAALGWQARIERWIWGAPDPGPNVIVETAAAPPYDPAGDPAQALFEEFLDHLHSYDFANDRLDRAREVLARMEREHPKSPYALLAQVELTTRFNRGGGASAAADEHASEVLNRIFAFTGRIPDAYVNRAKLALQRRDYASAHADAEKALKLAPEKPEVVFINARVFDELGDVEQAAGFYREYIALQKSELRQSNTYFWMAQMYARGGAAYEQQAKDAYLAAVSLDPRAPWKLYQYGEFLLTRTGDYEAAAHYLGRALEVMAHPTFASGLALAAYAKWADFHAYRGAHYRPFDDSSRRLDPASAGRDALARLAEATGLPAAEAFGLAAGHAPLGYVAETLLKAGAVKEIDYRSAQCKCTALAGAADAGNPALVALLLVAKANVDAENARGATPLLLAAWKGHAEVVQVLLKNGARPDAVDAEGDGPIHARMVRRRNDVVAALLAHRADPDLPRRDGSTLLCYAMGANDAELGEMLVRARADPNRPCGTRTPLETALHRNFAPGVRMLLAAGADPKQIAPDVMDQARQRSPEAWALIAAARGDQPAEAAASGAGAKP
jgi:tetratricopeptide (TPR) repeat protein